MRFIKYIIGSFSVGLVSINLFCYAKSEEPIKSSSASIKAINESHENDLKNIQVLRKQGKTEAALNLGLQHLKLYPNDIDVMLQLGLIYYQKKEYLISEAYINKVLAKSPRYLDAEIALIRIKLSQKEYNAANQVLTRAISQAPNDAGVIEVEKSYTKGIVGLILDKAAKGYRGCEIQRAISACKNYLSRHPNDIEIRLLLAKLYIQEKCYSYACAIYQKILCQFPCNTEAKIGLIDIALDQGRDVLALRLVNQDLRINPNNKDLLLKQIEIDVAQHKFAVAADRAKKLLRCIPCEKHALSDLEDINSINPYLAKGVNEIGFYTTNDHVSDLDTTWDWSGIYYKRDTSVGSISVGLNAAVRNGFRAIQKAIEFWPIINKNLSIDLIGTWAHQPNIFSTYTAGIEPYYTIANKVTVSAGFVHSYVIRGSSFDKYTGSLSTDIGKFWLSFRPLYFVPNGGKNSLLNTLTIRRYFNTYDTYLNLTVGAGKSPDLADLQTLNYIVIRNYFGTLGASIPICNHSALLNVGVEYNWWGYPSGLIRRLTGGTVGLSYRF